MKLYTPNSVLNFLGYEVLSETDGVYHLRLQGGRREFIAVLYALQPLTGVADAIHLLSFECPDGVVPDAVIRHWQTLDARRLEASGIDAQPAIITADYLPPGYSPGLGMETVYKRPLDAGERVTVTLTTGEVVCYS